MRRLCSILILLPFKLYTDGIRAEVQSILQNNTQNLLNNMRGFTCSLRKQKCALFQADISKRKTSSSQTHKSHYRNAVRVQTQENEDHNYQTKKDNYTNVPRLLNFVYGLRGRKDDKQFIITLTRPIEE